MTQERLKNPALPAVARRPPSQTTTGAGVEGRREVGDCVVSAAEAGEPCRRILCSRGIAVLDYPDSRILRRR